MEGSGPTLLMLCHCERSHTQAWMPFQIHISGPVGGFRRAVQLSQQIESVPALKSLELDRSKAPPGGLIPIILHVLSELHVWHGTQSKIRLSAWVGLCSRMVDTG